MLLGGRTAEEIFFDELTTGASNDIERATAIARRMVTEFGMSDVLGPQQFGEKNGEVFLGRDFGRQPNYSDDVASLIDREVRRFIDDAHATALDILTTHRAVLERFARDLVSKETLDSEMINEIFKDLGTWTKTPDAEVPQPLPIEPPRVEEPSRELVSATRRTMRGRAGRAWRGAVEGIKGGDDDGTPPLAPSGQRPRRPRLQPGAGPTT